MQLPAKDLDGDLEVTGDVQEDWEDASDVEEASRHEAMTSSTNGSQATHTISRRKKRRVQTKTTFVVASPAPPRGRPIKEHRRPPLVEAEVLRDAFADGARFTLSYAFDVVKGSIENMRRPLSWLLFLYMFTWLVSRLTSRALSPLCTLPGISKSALCTPSKPVASVDFERLINIQGSAFEQLLEESAGGSQLSIGVLKAEMATRDLALLVDYSELKSKDSIADILRTIGRDAKKTGRGLTKLNAKVVGAIDEVMALNNYVMATIVGAHSKAPSQLLRAISPVKLGPTAEEIVTEAFILAMDESERTIEKLVVEAEVSLQNLGQLDVDIEALQDVIAREDKYTNIEREKLLGELWTKIGGNRKAVRNYVDRLALLDDIEEYRKEAVARVKATLQALRTMSDDLEVLRERVVAPGLLGSKVPLHVHMESIQNGLARLQESRAVSRGGEMYDKTVRMLLPGSSE